MWKRPTGRTTEEKKSRGSGTHLHVHVHACTLLRMHTAYACTLHTHARGIRMHTAYACTRLQADHTQGSAHALRVSVSVSVSVRVRERVRVRVRVRDMAR